MIDLNQLQKDLITGLISAQHALIIEVIRNDGSPEGYTNYAQCEKAIFIYTKLLNTYFSKINTEDLLQKTKIDAIKEAESNGYEVNLEDLEEF